MEARKSQEGKNQSRLENVQSANTSAEGQGI